ncbi:MAG: DUF3187 family protein [Gammaproteobacteria bacterium]
MQRRIARGGGAMGLWWVCALAAAEPFAIIDHYPVARMFAPPAATSADFSGGNGQRFDVALDWSTYATVSTAVNEALILDGESVTLTGRWQWQRDGWRFGVDVPLTYQSGGTLDRFIDGFHNVFGFPEGDRPELPIDALRYRVAIDGQSRFDVRGNSSGFGDVLLHVGGALRQRSERGSAWRAHLKLPTGATDRLLGSGSAALGVQWQGFRNGRWRQRRVGLYGGAGAQWHDGADILADVLKPWVGFAHLGVEMDWSPRITLRSQLDVHTAHFDSDLKGLNQGLSLAVGGDIKLRSGKVLQLSVVEDIAPRTVPDVVFNLRWISVR